MLLVPWKLNIEREGVGEELIEIDREPIVILIAEIIGLIIKTREPPQY